MARSVDVFQVRARGAGELARDFDRAERQLQDNIVAEVRWLGNESVEILRRHAPEDTEDLKDALTAVPYFGRASEPRVTVRVVGLRGHQGTKRDSFDYFRTTRKGHRKRTIMPVRARALKVHIEGHRNPHAAIVRASVTGSGHPTQAAMHEAASRGTPAAQVRSAHKVRDWVQDAAPELQQKTREAERRLGRRLARSLAR